MYATRSRPRILRVTAAMASLTAIQDSGQHGAHEHWFAIPSVVTTLRAQFMGSKALLRKTT